jgi:hypothetical protein
LQSRGRSRTISLLLLLHGKSDISIFCDVGSIFFFVILVMDGCFVEIIPGPRPAPLLHFFC